MADEREFLEFAAGVLGVSPRSLSLETMYGSIPAWDSLAQLRLVTEGAVRYGVEIPFADVIRVTSLWEFYRRFNALSPKKVVAVDLDNTLWEGVVGEDGPDGIRPNVGFLKSLKSLKSRGILVVILSRNNEEDARMGLDRLEDLGGLTKDDFVTGRINWNEKADNLRDIATELNLGTEAFVFVDDNPAERLKMKTLLPEVAVLASPSDLAAYFPEGELTDEDRRKTEEYKAEGERKRFLEEYSCTKSLSASFLFEKLGVWVKVHEIKEEEIARVAQLSQKANQFNLCTNRLSEAEVRRLATKGLVITCHAGDNFGNQGLVAFAVVRIEADNAAWITDWVMSCRVSGRGVEEHFEEGLERILSERKVCGLTANWRDSGKNAPMRDLFIRLGFKRIGMDASVCRYHKCL